MAFSFKNSSNGKYLHGFMRWDYNLPKVDFMAVLGEQVEREDWYYGFSEDDRRIFLSTSADKLTFRVHFWYQSSSDVLPEFIRLMEYSENDVLEVLWADYFEA